MAPARQMKNKHNCKKLVIDVPIAPKEIVEDLKLIAHKVIALYFRTIGGVGHFYQTLLKLVTMKYKRRNKKIYTYNIPYNKE